MAISGKASPVGGVTLTGTVTPTFTRSATLGQVASNVVLEWDLDNDGDWDEPEEDLTSLVMSVESFRGRDYPSNLTGKSGPGKMRFVLNNDDDLFSPFNTASALNTAPFTTKTGRKVRLRTTDGDRGAATISYVGIGVASNGNYTSLTPTLPSGLVARDLMIIVAACRDTAASVNDSSLPGWVNLVDFGSLALYGRYYVTGDTAPTVTFTGGGANDTTMVQCMAFRGVRQRLSEVIGTSYATQTNASAQNIAVPGLVAAADTHAHVVVAIKQDDWTGVAALSGQFLSEISDTPTTTGDDMGLAIQYRLGNFSGAATFSSTNLTVTGGANAASKAIVFSLAPAVDVDDPIVLARDRFVRPADTNVLGTDELGTAWEVKSGAGFGARRGLARALDDYGAFYATDIVSTVDVGTPDHYVQASIMMPVQDGRVGVVARWSDGFNHVRAYYAAEDRGITVEWVHGGVVTDLGGGPFLIEAWEGMTLGLSVVDHIVKVYVGGSELDWGTDLQLYGGIASTGGGTAAGMYGYWETHSDVPPAFDEFYVWDRLGAPIDGVLWTGTVKDVVPRVVAGDLKVAEVTAEGVLSDAAVATIASPRIVRAADETEGANHSVPAGAIVGDIMARAGLLHPPYPLTTNPFSRLGAHAVDDDKALTVARAVELSERGFIYETPEGGVAFEDRDWRPGNSTPRAWFSDTPGTGQYGYVTIEPYDHKAQIINRATARVAPIAPTVVDVDNQSDDDTVLDVYIVVPEVVAGQLVVVFVACSADATNVEFLTPLGWKEHRPLRQADGNGMRIYTLISDGTESGTVAVFYKGTSPGTFIAHTYLIDDWFGTDDGIKVGRVSQGTNAYPVTPGWGRAPTLFIVFQCAIGSTGGILWGPLDTPPPIGYDYNSLEGLVALSASGAAYQTGVESVYKVDVTDTEQPRPWEDVFDDYLIIETVVFAVRGYDGPLTKGTLDSPRSAGGDGLVVTLDDTDSQIDHNFIRSNQEVPTQLYSEADAIWWAEGVLAEYADDRPIISISFVATKNELLRDLAIGLRLSDVVAVTATGNAGLGIDGEYRIESISHRFSHGLKLWATRYELSPA